jgi:hypothetical protein
MLILAIAGQPERGVAICDTYKKCSDMGADSAALYAAQFNAPRNFSYRVIPVIIVPAGPTT